MIIGVVAVDANFAIGENGTLGWHCPDDLGIFRRLTTFAKNNIVVFGRKTADSLKGPLKNRMNIVLTNDPSYSKAGFTVVNNIETILKMNDDKSNTCIAICGGAEIYKLFSPYISTLYMNHLDIELSNPDTYFPIDCFGFNMGFEYFRSINTIDKGCCKKSGISWKLIRYIRLFNNDIRHCNECSGTGVLDKYSFRPMCESCNGSGKVFAVGGV